MTTPIIEQTELDRQVAEGILIIWLFCPFCMDRQDQQFVRDEGKWEVYECCNCHHTNRVAVR